MSHDGRDVVEGAAQTRSPRLDALTGLRWWAAFGVFLFHVQVFAPLPSSTVQQTLDLGNYGVDFFFILSGFVLTWSLRTATPTSTFYTNRFARIYPSHFVALLLAIPIFTSLTAPPADAWWVHPFNIGIIGLSVVLLQGWSRDPAILFSGNPAAWTLTCEAFFYALHPWLSRVLGRFGVRGALTWVVIALAIFVVSETIAGVDAGGWWATSLPLPIAMLPEFVIGMGIGWAFRNGWRPRISLWLAFGLAGLAVAVVVATPIVAPDSLGAVVTSWYIRIIVTIACSILIIATASRALSSRPTVLGSRSMVALGEWSFAFYLLHATVIYLAMGVFGPRDPSWMNVLVMAPLLGVGIVSAWALHRFVERPFERRIRRWKADRDLARASAAGAGAAGS